MARPSDRLLENAPGPLYVDSSCIDCATCRELLPDIYGDLPRGLSYVKRQPATEPERRRALMALVACPTSSIGTDAADAADVRAAGAAFPEPVAADVDDVLFCGYTAASSFGAWSYLVRRSEGNVLVDSPRAAGPLMKRLAQLGGVALMVLSHRDDVADHGAYARAFGCRRVLHADDVGPDTADVEWKVAGRDPMALAPDLLFIPVPGHTKGSGALLYRDTFLFTGDHLWGRAPRAGLGASRSVCWHSWPEQIRSMERLREHRFTWVLPGHGPIFRAASEAAMTGALDELIGRMKRRAARV